MRLQFMSSPPNQGKGGDLAVNTTSRYVPSQLRHRRLRTSFSTDLSSDISKFVMSNADGACRPPDTVKVSQETFPNNALIIYIPDEDGQLPADWWRHGSQSGGAIFNS